MAALRADTPPAPEVVLIDPMFPGERKTAERKAMAVLRWIAGDDPDAEHLLSPALQTATRRVVVKRPRAAGPLNGQPPTVVHGGRGQAAGLLRRGLVPGSKRRRGELHPRRLGRRPGETGLRP